MTLATGIKRAVDRRIGYLRVFEARNRIVLGPAALRARRFENSEVRRLSREIGSRPRSLVTTVIVTYKRPELLERALESALAQTVADNQIVVVDDGGGVLTEVKDPRVLTVSLKHNRGILGLCRNVGIRLTDSTYVAFLDDDNTWEPAHLEVALQALSKGPDVVYTALRRVLVDGQEMDIHSEAFDRRAMARGASQADSNAIVARRVPDLRFSLISRPRHVLPPEDWELIFRLSRRYAVEHVPVPTVRYLINPNSYYTAWNPEIGNGSPGAGIQTSEMH